MTGWVVAGDAALREQHVRGNVAEPVQQPCQRGRRPTAGAFTLLFKANCVITTIYQQEADFRSLPRS